MTPGNEEFQDSIKQAVPDGHTFKGYPIQFSHRNARKAFATCLRLALSLEKIIIERLYSHFQRVCALVLLKKGVCIGYHTEIYACKAFTRNGLVEKTSLMLYPTLQT